MNPHPSTLEITGLAPHPAAVHILPTLALLEAWTSLPGPCRDGVLRVAKAALTDSHVCPVGISRTAVKAAYQHLVSHLSEHHQATHEPTRWLLHELAVWLDEVGA